MLQHNTSHSNMASELKIANSGLTSVQNTLIIAASYRLFRFQAPTPGNLRGGIDPSGTTSTTVISIARRIVRGKDPKARKTDFPEILRPVRYPSPKGSVAGAARFPNVLHTNDLRRFKRSAPQAADSGRCPWFAAVQQVVSTGRAGK